MHSTKNLLGPAFTHQQRRHSQLLIRKDCWGNENTTVYSDSVQKCFLSSNERQIGLWSVVFAGGRANSSVLAVRLNILCCMIILCLIILCCLLHSRYRSAEWPAALLIRLSDSYLGKHWRTLGNCFYDSGTASPLWTRRHVNTSQVTEHVLGIVFKLNILLFSPIVHNISCGKSIFS